jgi:hypothetical protein
MAQYKTSLVITADSPDELKEIAISLQGVLNSVPKDTLKVLFKAVNKNPKIVAKALPFIS